MQALARLVRLRAAGEEQQPARQKQTRALAKVVGSETAKAVKVQRRMSEAKQTPDVYEERLGEARSHPSHVPLQPEELKRFRDSRVSAGTMKSEASRLRTVKRILDREFPGTKNDAMQETLDAHKNLEGYEVVAASLAMEAKASGPQYLSAWSKVGVRTSAEVDEERLALARTVRKFGGEITQAPELPVQKLASEEALARVQPLHRGGVWMPYTSVLVWCLLMLRGLAFRSLRMRQIKFERGGIVVRFGVRKANQLGHRSVRSLPLECMCSIEPRFCVACVFSKYLKVRESLVSSDYVFTNKNGEALTRRSATQTLKLVGRHLGVLGASQHSCRLSGAKAWASMGLSETSVAVLGDWRSIAVLRRYIGTSGLTRRMIMEISMARSMMPQQRAVGPPVAVLPETLESALRILQQEPPQDLALVVLGRVPRRWHKVSMLGPSSRWTTGCGQPFSSTMVLQRWCERPRCDELCRRHGCA
jgi:hypothetical protein